MLETLEEVMEKEEVTEEEEVMEEEEMEMEATIMMMLVTGLHIPYY